MDEQPEREEITVAVVGPDPRLLLVLVVLLVGAALVAVFLLGGDDDSGRVSLGRLQDLAAQTEAGPVRIAELPHLVVSRSRTAVADHHSVRWGDNDGAVRIDPHVELVVLETTDPEDGAPLTWCRAARAFAHPDGDRWYAADGRLLRGQGPRGLDRRAVLVNGEGVIVDDSRWVQGISTAGTETAWSPRGSCLD